jgi:hypothetical protein
MEQKQNNEFQMIKLPSFLAFNDIKSKGQLLDQSRASDQLLWHEEKNQVGQVPVISKAVNFSQLTKFAKIEYTCIMRPPRERLSMIKSSLFFFQFASYRGAIDQVGLVQILLSLIPIKLLFLILNNVNVRIRGEHVRLVCQAKNFDRPRYYASAL